MSSRGRRGGFGPAASTARGPLPATAVGTDEAFTRWVGVRALELARGPEATTLWVALDDPDGGAAGRLAHRLGPVLQSLPSVRRLAVDRTVGTGFGCDEALGRALHVAGTTACGGAPADLATLGAIDLRRVGDAARPGRPPTRLLVVQVDDLHDATPDTAQLVERLLFPPLSHDDGSRRPRTDPLAPLLLLTSSRRDAPRSEACERILGDALGTLARLPADRPGRFTRRVTALRRSLTTDPAAAVPLLVEETPAGPAAAGHAPGREERDEALAVLSAAVARGGPFWFRVARWTAGDLVRLFAADHRRHGAAPTVAVALAPDDAALAHALWRRVGDRPPIDLEETATAIRERHRAAWADAALLPGTARSAPTTPGRGEATAVLRVTLAAHVAAVHASDPRPFALWDAALSAQLLATLCAGTAPELEAAAVRRYLELTAAWERVTDEPLDWHAPVAAGWAQGWRGLSTAQRGRVVDALAARAAAAGEDRGGSLLRHCHGTPACLAAARSPSWPPDHRSPRGRAQLLWRLGELGDEGEPLLRQIDGTVLDLWLEHADGPQLRALADAFAARDLEPPVELRSAALRRERLARRPADDPLRALAGVLNGTAAATERGLRVWERRHGDAPRPAAEQLRIGTRLLDVALQLTDRGRPDSARQAHLVWRRVALGAYGASVDDSRNGATIELTGYRLLRLALALARADRHDDAGDAFADVHGPAVAGDVLLHLALELADAEAHARRVEAVARIVRSVIRHGTPAAREQAVRRTLRLGRLLGADEPRAELNALLEPIFDGLDGDQRETIARALWHGPDGGPPPLDGVRTRRARRVRVPPPMLAPQPPPAVVPTTPAPTTAPAG